MGLPSAWAVVDIHLCILKGLKICRWHQQEAVPRTIAEEKTGAHPTVHVAKPNSSRGRGYPKVRCRIAGTKANPRRSAPNATVKVRETRELRRRATEDRPWMWVLATKRIQYGRSLKVVIVQYTKDTILSLTLSSHVYSMVRLSEPPQRPGDHAIKPIIVGKADTYMVTKCLPSAWAEEDVAAKESKAASMGLDAGTRTGCTTGSQLTVNKMEGRERKTKGIRATRTGDGLPALNGGLRRINSGVDEENRACDDTVDRRGDVMDEGAETGVAGCSHT
ncbi:hypothetical protein BJ912DRAFT_922373 [Pholiota molesta]|nr:hypothetical protein BJ912DRAFT_922373 [Pholiota molesta]